MASVQALISNRLPVADFDVASQVSIALRVGLAAVLGAAVGWERERSGKTAGVRTHMLVSAASALAVGVGDLVVGKAGSGDPTRTLHAVITGVGFLGAGLIFRERKGSQPSGVTSAATILLVAVIGATCGVGAPVLAGVVMLMALLTLAGIGRIEKVVSRLRPTRSDDEPPSD